MRRLLWAAHLVVFCLCGLIAILFMALFPDDEEE